MASSSPHLLSIPMLWLDTVHDILDEFGEQQVVSFLFFFFFDGSTEVNYINLFLTFCSCKFAYYSTDKLVKLDCY